MKGSNSDGLILEQKRHLSRFLNLWSWGVRPVAYLTLDHRSVSLPVLMTKEELRLFLCDYEVNQVRVPFSAAPAFSAYQDELLASGLPILIEDKDGQVVQRLNIFKINKPLNRVLKRSLDILGALIGLVIYLALFIWVKAKVTKESPGDIIFRQERVGRRGRRFKMQKFRSMYLDAEERKAELMAQNEVSSQHMFKVENDPRVFPFGQKMRDSSIDEIPQFINVLKGDMSLIGTRPPTIDEYKHYEFHHFKRSAIKPGITGLWQVSGRSDIKDFEKVVALDVEYIETWSIWKDIKILVKTLVVVLKKVGAR